MKQANKYAAFKDTPDVDTKVVFFATHREAMSFKINEEQFNSLDPSMEFKGWTVATVDPVAPSWFRKMWLWLERKYE